MEFPSHGVPLSLPHGVHLSLSLFLMEFPPLSHGVPLIVMMMKMSDEDGDGEDDGDHVDNDVDDDDDDDDDE